MLSVASTSRVNLNDKICIPSTHSLYNLTDLVLFKKEIDWIQQELTLYQKQERGYKLPNVSSAVNNEEMINDVKLKLDLLSSSLPLIEKIRSTYRTFNSFLVEDEKKDIPTEEETTQSGNSSSDDEIYSFGIHSKPDEFEPEPEPKKGTFKKHKKKEKVLDLGDMVSDSETSSSDTSETSSSSSSETEEEEENVTSRLSVNRVLKKRAKRFSTRQRSKRVKFPSKIEEKIPQNRCVRCFIRFKTRSQLNQHVREEKGHHERSQYEPLNCFLCNKSFVSSKNLYRHVDKHHNKDEYMDYCPPSYAKSFFH